MMEVDIVGAQVGQAGRVWIQPPKLYRHEIDVEPVGTFDGWLSGCGELEVDCPAASTIVVA